jgi:hypothetical protein
MSTTPDPSTSRPGGASRVAGQPARRKWLLPLLLGLLALIALLFLLSQCGDDDSANPTAGTAASPAATPSGAGAAPSATGSASASGPADAGQTGAGQPGTVTAGGASLLGSGTAANLGGSNGEQAVGRAVRVQSVPADEGFWVGTSETDRLWVQLTGTRGESDYTVKAGDIIEFTGTVTSAAEGFAAKVGVSEAEGAAQLTDQGYYVSVPASSVKLSR